MSSFVKKGSSAGFHARTQQHIPASCKATSSGCLVASTGIASLDTILGDGMPMGRVILLLEDQPRSSSNYANTILKCFIAQGLVSDNTVVFVGEDEEKVTASLPGTSSRSDQQVVPPKDEPGQPKSKEKMSIAWRYKHIQQVESSLDAPSSYGHQFDLGKRLEGPRKVVPLSDEAFSTGSLVRVALRSLGSPLFPVEPGKLYSWFFDLVRRVKSAPYAVMMVTLTRSLMERHLFESIASLCDATFDVQSFAGTSRETDPAFKEYQGFFRIVKPLRLPDSLALAIPETANLAFKCKQRRFIIEKFHLPPELGDAPSSTASCSTVDF